MFTNQCLCFRFQLLFQSLHSPWSCQFEPEPCPFWLLSRFQALRPTGRSSRFCCFALSWSCLHSQLIGLRWFFEFQSKMLPIAVESRLSHFWTRFYLFRNWSKESPPQHRSRRLQLMAAPSKLWPYSAGLTVLLPQFPILICSISRSMETSFG